MLRCPRDQTLLARTRLSAGLVWVCNHCGGRAVTMPVLRRQLEPAVSVELWREAIRSGSAGVACAACWRPTSRVDLVVEDLRVHIDVCRPCSCVWFDRGELQQLPAKPPPPPPPDELPLEARQRVAILEVQERARQRREAEQEAPSLALKRLPALLGLPVELAESTASPRPWLTWATSGLVLVVSAIGFQRHEVIEAMQLVPDQLLRSLGLTVFTSFFVHADWLHLLGNLWFLLIFGDNVEQLVGRKRWLVLLAGATLLGGLAHTLLDPRGSLPLVGASGGISGLIVCYALCLPDARLGIFVYPRYSIRPIWITFSARAGVLVWIVLQLPMLLGQAYGVGGVSALAHLGGALAGLLFWLQLRADT